MILDSKKNYLKSADVNDGDSITILSEGEWIESRRFTNPDGSAKNQFVIELDYAGEAKHLTLNATNRGALIMAFGKETKDWINKRATIQKIKVSVAGSIKDSIILCPEQ